MMVFKRKQIVVLALVLMILAAGYLQYNYRQSSISISEKDNEKLGQAVYVDGDNKTSAGTTVSASKQATDFFAQAKLDKEISRSKDTESLKTLSADTTASKEIKLKAQENVLKISENSQKETRIETLVMEKGFNDALALFGDDGSVDVVVKSPTLTSAQVAQISDIVSRQANVPISKIHIKNIF